SAVNSSTMRVPVRPPASPVATTGMSSRFSARATLIPFPPASERPWLARWRWPRWKFGTVSVRSRPAFNVTVTIMWPGGSRKPAPQVRERAPTVEAEPSEQPRAGDRAGGDERRARDEPAAGEDAHLSEPLAAPHGQVGGRRRDDALPEWPVDPHRAQHGPRGNERHRRLPIRRRDAA